MSSLAFSDIDSAKESPMAKDFNDLNVVENYDAHIRKLIPAYEQIHLQVHALLKTYVVDDARVLVVGCGTGYELQYLAEQFPTWQFIAIDPAPNMLEKAKQHIENIALSSQVEFKLGDTSILKYLDQRFDVALAILVSHFVATDLKLAFFQDIGNSLSKTGLCLSYELTCIESQQQLQSIKNLALMTGLAEKQVDVMAKRMEQDFALISADELKNIYKQAGFASVETFAQVLNYYGFIGFKAKMKIE